MIECCKSIFIFLCIVCIFFYLHERCYQQLQVFGKNKIFNFMIITSQPIKESLDYIHLWVREKDEEKTCYVFSGLKISLNIIHNSPKLKSVQFSSLGQSCPTCWDPMDFCMTCFPVHHQVPEITQPHIHRVGDAIQPSHPLLPPSFAFNLSQHQGLFQWVSSSHHVAKVLAFQLQHQSFQWTFRTDFL